MFTVLWIASAAGAGLSWLNKGRLPPARDMRRETWRAPLQRETDERPFSFSYRGRPYDVKPLAAYEIWGVVVSRNHISSLADLVHDKDSVDTADACLAWGQAAANPELSKVKFSSGQFTCYFKYPGDVVFEQGDVSNNHLITDRESIREGIAALKTGDQVHMKGLLVSYRPADQPNNWRTSSLRRTDTGNGACEVLFVRELDYMARGTPRWYALWNGSLAGLILFSMLKLVLFFVW